MVQGYTIVLVQTPDGIVMINRHKPPYQGLWNGLGGKIESGETPLAGALREVQEESGETLPTARSAGVADWVVDGELVGRLHLFVGTTKAPLVLPRATREGILAVFAPEWLQAPANMGLVPDMQALLPYMLDGKVHHLVTVFAKQAFLGLEVKA